MAQLRDNARDVRAVRLAAATGLRHVAARVGAAPETLVDALTDHSIRGCRSAEAAQAAQDPRTKRRALRHPVCPPGLRRVGSDNSDGVDFGTGVMVWAGRHSAGPRMTRRRAALLAVSEDASARAGAAGETRRALSESSNRPRRFPRPGTGAGCPPLVLCRLASDSERQVRHQIASSETVPAAALRALTTDNDPWTAGAAAANRRCSPEALTPLAAASDPLARAGAATNPSTPPSAAQHLLDDPDEMVRMFAHTSARAAARTVRRDRRRARSRRILGRLRSR